MHLAIYRLKNKVNRNTALVSVNLLYGNLYSIFQHQMTFRDGFDGESNTREGCSKAHYPHSQVEYEAIFLHGAMRIL